MIKNRVVLDENKLDEYVLDAKDASFYTGNYCLKGKTQILYMYLFRFGILPFE